MFPRGNATRDYREQRWREGLGGICHRDCQTTHPQVYRDRDHMFLLGWLEPGRTTPLTFEVFLFSATCPLSKNPITLALL
jgi:hypothetical protein